MMFEHRRGTGDRAADHRVGDGLIEARFQGPSHHRLGQHVHIRRTGSDDAVAASISDSSIVTVVPIAPIAANPVQVRFVAPGPLAMAVIDLHRRGGVGRANDPCTHTEFVRDALAAHPP